MDHIMERWYSATGQRFSMRNYAGDPDAAELTALQSMAEMLGSKTVRIALCNKENVFRALFLGSGKVRGATGFAAVVQKEGAAQKAGYLGESFILECTALGLGTCWLGGSYKRSAAAEAAGLQEGEKLAAIIAFGKPGEKYIGRPRKALSELTDMDQAQLQALPEWQQLALSCARSAPSAINAQPWRFMVKGDALCIRRTSGNFGFGEMDQGIAMLHMELGAAHGGVAGSWTSTGDKAVFRPLS